MCMVQPYVTTVTCDIEMSKKCQKKLKIRNCPVPVSLRSLGPSLVHVDGRILIFNISKSRKMSFNITS